MLLSLSPARLFRFCIPYHFAFVRAYSSLVFRLLRIQSPASFTYPLRRQVPTRFVSSSISLSTSYVFLTAAVCYPLWSHSRTSAVGHVPSESLPFLVFECSIFLDSSPSLPPRSPFAELPARTLSTAPHTSATPLIFLFCFSADVPLLALLSDTLVRTCCRTILGVPVL